MASETIAISTSYHKPILSCRKSKLDTPKVHSEDELLKFFLHGSYDVQRGNMSVCRIEKHKDKILCTKDDTVPVTNVSTDDKDGKSRCMFEETYMINISVKQPDAPLSSKQIDVSIEKTPSDKQIENEKVDPNDDDDDDDDDDEISSIFDEENDEVDSVSFSEINPSITETSSAKLTLADMINKTLTTIPAPPSDNNINKLNKNNNWFVEQPSEITIRKTDEHVPSTKAIEQVIKTPPPNSMSSIIETSTLTTNISEDEKLFEYLDYLEMKEETSQPISSITVPIAVTKNSRQSAPCASKVPLKQQQQQQQPVSSQLQESIPIVDLEQLCRSLTVNDLKDECIRRKLFELKLLIDERHKKQRSQIPLIMSRKDNLPILIAMPPMVQQRCRTNPLQPTALFPPKNINSQTSHNTNYFDTAFNYTPKYSPSSSSTNNHQYTRNQTCSTKHKL